MAIKFHTLLPPHWQRDIESWIKDDVPSIDIGGLVVGDKMEEATLYGKTKGVLAGVPFFNGTPHAALTRVLTAYPRVPETRAALLPVAAFTLSSHV